MEYVISWGGEVEDVSVRTSGQASLEGLRAFVLEGLSDSRWRPGMRVLLDHRELDWTTMSSGDLRARADALVQESERLRNSRVAVVAGRSVDYGLQRIMEAYGHDGYMAVMDVMMFYSVEEARAWLSRFPGPLAI